MVATPTGSTGYNMYAGGPIVEPLSNLLLLTPICPHSLCSKSIVLSSDKNIKLQIPYNKSKKNIKIYFDCDKNIELSPGDYIEISKSEKYLKLIKINEDSFMKK